MGLNTNQLKLWYKLGKNPVCKRHGLEERRALKLFYRRARRRKGKEALRRLLRELE